MKVHEYQGKKIFSDYGMPVQDGYVFEKLENASMACSTPDTMALGGASHTRYFRFQASINIFLFIIF